MTVFLILGFASWAGAQTYYAEVSLGDSSMEAMRVYREFGSPSGSDRLVRRYRQGQGWEYFFLSRDFDTAAAALEKAVAWTAALGRPVATYRDGGGLWEPTATPQHPPLPGAGLLTARLKRTLGGAGGGQQQLARVEHVRFVYERGVEEDGVYYVMKHAFSRRAGQLHATIEPMGDVGVSSRLSWDGETAEAWAQDEAVEPVDAIGVAELLAGMGPAAVFGFLLELPALLESAPRYQNLELSKSVDRDGRRCGVLESAGSEGGVQLVVDPVDWWLVEASILGDMGLVTYRFGDWREIDTNLALPFQVELVREGRVLEKLRVLELSLETPERRPEAAATSLLNPLP